MATYKIIKLKEMSPLHMGTGKENYDFSANQLHSDTLSSALAAMRVANGQYEGIKEFLEAFTISSAFPYIGDRYFLPRPLGKIENIMVGDDSEEEQHTYRKSLKKIKYVELGLWQRLISGVSIKVTPSQLQGEYLCDTNHGNIGKIYTHQVAQRATVPLEGETKPFFFDWTFFNEQAGLFCIIDVQNVELWEEIKSLFTLLGEVGLGTDKNIGGGKFIIEPNDITINEPDEANASMLLSLYIPTQGEIEGIDLDNSRFELLQRGGYIAGSQECDFWHLRKKSIYMMGVGSALKTSTTLSGKVVDLQPAYNDERIHSVYRSGKPFVVPVKI